jgi:WS/DGAT/MGAT family acyltransferase
MDSAFLSLETPESPMHVVGVLLLDPSAGEGFSIETLRRVVAERLHLMPPFCRRLVPVPLSLGRPSWHYDHEVDLSEHVFDVEIDPPGDLRALGALVGEIASSRLDRSIPLWELHIVTGLADDRVALVAKVHHSTLYGAAGAEFIAELLDLSPQIESKPPPPESAASPPLGRMAATTRVAASTAGVPLKFGGMVVRGARSAGGTARSLASVASRFGRAALPPAVPSSPISGPPTVARMTAFTSLSLPDVKRVKDAAGVTVNDVILTVVALSVARYLERRDALPGRPLVAGVPVNAGEGESAGTNSLATMMVALPLQAATPRALLGDVHRSAAAAKAFTAAVGVGAVAELADLAPPALLSGATWLTRSLGLATLQPTLFNLVVSNVMGPPIPLYLAGAAVEAIMPMGPLLAGAGMNVTFLSNLDRLDIGIMACPDLVEDVWEIADALPACLTELLAGA